MRLLPAAALVLLVGCGSSDEAEQRPAPATRRAAPAPPPAREPEAPRKAGTVVFTVKDADLATEVLPLFEQQVGLKILWTGDPRKVSLRLVQPIPWPDALDLVCQFTKTHPTRDYQDRLVLKNGWGGSLGSGDLRALEQKGAAGRSGGSSAASRPSGGSSGGGAAWDDGSRPASSGGSGSGIPQPTGAYSGGDEAGRILRGASTTSSGPR